MRVVVVSFALHAAAFALVLRVPRRERSPEPAPLTPIEIVDEEPPPVPAFPPPSSDGEGAGTASSARIAGVASRSNDVATGVAEPTLAPTGEASAPGPAPVWSGSFATLGPKELGIARENPFFPSSPPPIASNKPDLGLRFGPSSEGPALTVLREAASSSLAPLNGHARFTVRANAEGEILGIDLDEAYGGDGWKDARRLALEGLRGKKLFVPRGARGINVRFEIVSELSYPTGQKSPGEFAFSGGVVILPDESNIGQRPTRKIHARHLGTEIL